MNDFEEMIGASVKDPADKKASKEKLPQIKLTKVLSESLLKFIDAKKREKVAAGEKVLAEQPVLKYCQEKLDADALKGEFNHSYEISTIDGKTVVKFITADKFSVSQDKENIEALKESLGEKFQDYFETKIAIEAKPEIFTDKELQKELVGLLGDKFSKFFTTTKKYATKDKFNESIYKIANGDANKLKSLRTLVPQSKPFFK